MRKTQTPKKNVRYSRSAPRRTVPNRPRPNYLLLFSIFGITTIFSGSIAFALRTPALNVAKVQVKGVRLANMDAVKSAADCVRGRNILLLHKSPVISDIRAITEVSDVRMGRKFPNQVWVRVWERKPDAVLTDGSNYCLAQLNGFVFHRADGPVAGVPLIIVRDSEKLKPGVTASSDTAQSALEALRYARREGIKLDKISVDPQGDMCLNMGSDFCVKLGQPDELELKMSLLRRALVHRPSLIRDGAYIDLSCPNRPAWKPKEVAQA